MTSGLRDLSTLWGGVQQQQSDAYKEGIQQLEQMLAKLEEIKDQVSSGSLPTSASLTATQQHSTAARTQMTKDFKALSTALAKISTKIDKTFSVELDEFCPSELYGSPAWAEAQMKLKSATDASNGSSSSNAHSATTAAAATDVNDDASSYLRALDDVIEETWLRDGRMELVESLRKETGRAQHTPMQMQAASAQSATTAASDGEIERSDGGDAVERDFARLHALLDSLKHRDADPCVAWILDRKAALKRQIMRLEADLSSAQEEGGGDEGSASSASTAATAAAAARRKRVSFSSDEKNSESASASASAASSASSSAVASLSPRLASLHSSYDALHTLQFDLHRLKFLQLLVSSEESTRTKHAQRGQQQQLQQQPLHNKNGTRKRKNGDQSEDDEEDEESKQDSNGSGSAATTSSHHPRKDRRSGEMDGGAGGGDITMQDAGTAEEEEAALAADETSSSSDDSDNDGRSPKIHEEDEGEGASDEDLNNLAASARRAVGLDVPASASAAKANAAAKAPPTNFSHHAALKYAQTFFPEFAATRMEDIHRLSGCLIFLGELTSSSGSGSSGVPTHPYASLFSRAGNTALWRDALTRAKRMYLQSMHRPENNPVSVSLRACDISIPQLLKYAAVRKLNRDMLGGDRGLKSNPELNLGDEFQFHSTFVCPVTKEQCTGAADTDIGAPILDLVGGGGAAGGGVGGGHAPPPMMMMAMYGEGLAAVQALMARGAYGAAAVAAVAASAARPAASAASAAAAAAAPPSVYGNPPVMLKCGHCISQQAMEKIVRNLRLSRRFKCPTCPQEQLPSDVLILHL